MAGAAFGLFLVTLLVWVPAVWIYFDAEERGHSAYLWGGLALIPFWNVLVIVAYFIARTRKKPRWALAYSRSRIYQHVAVVTFWALLAFSAVFVLHGLIEYATEETVREERPGLVLREHLAFAFGLLVVAGPAFAVHFLFMSRELRRTADIAAERLAMARLQFGLFSLIAIVSGLFASISAVVLVFEGSSRLFGVGDVDRDLSIGAVSVLPVAFISLGLARIVFWRASEFQRSRALMREADEADAATAPGEGSTNLATASAEPVAQMAATSPTAEARFCIQCGSAMPSRARFCPNCGESTELT